MGFYIKEVAERVNLPAHTLRYYEKEGLLPFVKRDENGHRIFEEKDMSWLELITCLRQTGISLAELQSIVELTKQGDQTIAERRAILENHHEKMKEQQRSLARAFEKIEEKMGYYEQMEEKTKI